MLVQPLRKSKEEETFAAKTGRYDQAWAVPIPDCYFVNDCALHHEEVQPSHLLGDAFCSEVVKVDNRQIDILPVVRPTGMFEPLKRLIQRE